VRVDTEKVTGLNTEASPDPVLAGFGKEQYHCNKSLCLDLRMPC